MKDYNFTECGCEAATKIRMAYMNFIVDYII